MTGKLTCHETGDTRALAFGGRATPGVAEFVQPVLAALGIEGGCVAATIDTGMVWRMTRLSRRGSGRRRGTLEFWTGTSDNALALLDLVNIIYLSQKAKGFSQTLS